MKELKDSFFMEKVGVDSDEFYKKFNEVLERKFNTKRDRKKNRKKVWDEFLVEKVGMNAIEMKTVLKEKFDLQYPYFWDAWNGYPKLRKEIIAEIKEDQPDINKDDLEELLKEEIEKRDSSYNDYKHVPRTKNGLGLKTDSYYKYGTTRSYQGNEPLGLPSSIALGVCSANESAWKKFNMQKWNLPHYKNNKKVRNTDGTLSEEVKEDDYSWNSDSIVFNSGSASKNKVILPATKGKHYIRIEADKGNAAFSDEEKLLVNFHYVPENAKICYYCISHRGDKWYISFNMIGDRMIPDATEKTETVGGDVGVVHPMTTYSSDGRYKHYDYNKIPRYKRLAKRRKALQKELSSKYRAGVKFERKTPSKKYIKLRSAISEIDRKMAEMKEEVRHHVSHVLTKSFSQVVLEDLKLSNMTKEGGSHKRGLNRSLLGSALFDLKNKIRYKGEWRGQKPLVLVDPKHTSLTCSNCGHVHKDNRISQDKFICLECGYEFNADMNAAKNIWKKGQETP